MEEGTPRVKKRLKEVRNPQEGRMGGIANLHAWEEMREKLVPGKCRKCVYSLLIRIISEPCCLFFD
jgi:hypothetical protein